MKAETGKEIFYQSFTIDSDRLKISIACLVFAIGTGLMAAHRGLSGHTAFRIGLVITAIILLISCIRVYVAHRGKILVTERPDGKLSVQVSSGKKKISVDPVAHVAFLCHLHRPRGSRGFIVNRQHLLFLVFYNEAGQPCFALTESYNTHAFGLPPSCYEEDRKSMVDTLDHFNGPVEEMRRKIMPD